MPPAKKCDGVDGEDVRAERRDLIVDALLRAGARGQHRDDGAHADDDAEHRQGRAEQVRANRLQRNDDDLAKQHGVSACRRVPPNLGSPTGVGQALRAQFFCRLASSTLSTRRAYHRFGERRGQAKAIVRRAARAALRCCSLRNFFAVSAGSALALLPLISVGPGRPARSRCCRTRRNIRTKRYGYELALTRLQRNAPARDWLAAADRALAATAIHRVAVRKSASESRSGARDGLRVHGARRAARRGQRHERRPARTRRAVRRSCSASRRCGTSA